MNSKMPEELVRRLALGVLIGALPAQDPVGRPVSTITIQRGPITRDVMVPAEVLPLESARLVPRVTGVLASVAAREGDLVEGEKVLATLACPDLAAELEVRTAGVGAAESQVELAENATAAAEQQVAVSDSRVTASQAAARAAELAENIASIDYGRTAKLHEVGAATQEQLDHATLRLERARTDVEARRAAVDAAGADLLEARANVEVRRAEYARAEAELRVATARRSHAAVMVAFGSIENPYPRSRVTRQFAFPGELMTADRTAVLEVMNVSKVRVRFSVAEVDAGFVRTGTPARIVQPHRAGDDVSTAVTRVTGALDTGTRAMAAEIELDNADGRWMPGSLCSVVLRFSLEDGIAAPARALVKQDPDVFGWVVREGRAQRVRLRAGMTLGRRVQILSGLADGDQLIVGGSAGLSDGDPVEPTEVTDR